MTLTEILTSDLEAHHLTLWKTWPENVSAWMSYSGGRWVCFVYPDYVEVRLYHDDTQACEKFSAADPDFTEKVFEAIDKIVMSINIEQNSWRNVI